MEKRKFNARVQHKIDTYENWDKATKFPPLEGEIVIYTPDPKDPDDTRPVKIKVGDGKTFVGDLPFVETAAAGGAGGGAVTPQIQSDWLQENPSKKDYIKNKPFYDNSVNIEWTGPTSEFIDVLDTLNVISYKVSDKIIDTQDIVGYEVKWTSNDNDILSFIIDNSNIVPVDDNFFVIFDDTAGLIGICLKDGTYNFMGATFENVTSGIWFNYNPFTNYGPLSLSKTDIKQIDEKYIPDIFIKSESIGEINGIASLDEEGKIPLSQLPNNIKTENINQTQVDYNQNDYLEMDYIKNRPFFETVQSFGMKKDNIVNYDTFELNIWNLPSYKEKLGLLKDGIFERVESYKVSDKILTEEELFGSVLYILPSDSFPYYKVGIEMLGKIFIDESFFEDEDNIIYSDDDCLITMFFTMSKTEKIITLETGETINIPSKGTYFNYSFQEGGGVIRLAPRSLVNLDNTLIVDLDEYTTFIAQRVNENFIPSDYLIQSTISLSLEEYDITIDSSKVIAAAENFLTPEIIPEGWMLMFEDSLPIAISLSEFTNLPGPDNNLIPLEKGTYLISIQDKETKELICECNKIFRQDITKKIDNKFLPKVSTFDTTYLASNFFPLDGLEVDCILCNLYKFITNIFSIGVLNKEDLLFTDMQFADTLVIKNAGNIGGINFGTIYAKDNEKVVVGVLGDLIMGDDLLDFKDVKFCKTITIDTPFIEADKPFDVIAIADPTNPMNYLGFISYGGSGDGSDIIIDQMVQENSEYAVSSKAVYDAIQNIKINTDAQIVENSTNPVCGGAVYDSLQGYKFRISDHIPTEEDNLPDNIITFVF